MNDKLLGQSFSKLPRSKKTALIFLSVTAVGILVVWFWQFNSRINNPFIVKPNEQDLAVVNKVDEVAASKIKDTDHDGLTDFDETNVYHTSPYLEDTDGDGFLDGVEVKAGKNPLCPEGADCNQNIQVATSTSPTNIASSTPGDNVNQALLIQALSGAGDAAGLRQILLQSGADKTTLDKVSDADLMLSYQEVLKAQNPQALIPTQDIATSTISQ